MSWLLRKIGGSNHMPSENAPINPDNYDSKIDTNSFSSSISQKFDINSFDPSKLHPLAGLDKPLDYIVLEEEELNKLPGSKSLLPSRGWSDDLCYGTGTTYVTALLLGGAYGFVEGFRNTQHLSANKLKVNGILNAITRRGPFLANSAAVVALIYNIICCSFDYIRGKHDWENSVASGILSGAMFKSTKGMRQMLIAGSVTGTAAVAWCSLKHILIYEGPQNSQYKI